MSTRPSADKSLPDLLGDLKTLVVDYARQETLDPIKALGRFVAFGVLGSLLVGIGLALGVLAVLRVLQAETGTTFTGDMSWAPYVITAAICFLFIFIALAAASRGGNRR